MDLKLSRQRRAVLAATAIVAIGFLAVFQLVNYSVNSIDVSAERTKINYITSMVAEDMIGSRDQTANTNPASKQCSINDYGQTVALDGSACPETVSYTHLTLPTKRIV